MVFQDKQINYLTILFQVVIVVKAEVSLEEHGEVNAQAHHLALEIHLLVQVVLVQIRINQKLLEVVMQETQAITLDTNV